MTWVLFAALVVLGVYALPKLRVESMPEVELPSLTISTSWTGASPSAVQRAITVPIEEAVRRVHGIEKVVARSYPAFSWVEVSFRRDVDVEFARLELAEQVGAVRRTLPLNATSPQIRGEVPEEFSRREFFTVSLISPLDPNELREFAEKWIVPQVMSVEGVANAEVRGGANRLLRIVLDRERLRVQRLSPDAILRAIRTLDDVTAGGVVRRGAMEMLVSIRDAATIERFAEMIVARRGERLIRLRELAEIDWDHEDPSYLIRINGENMVMLHVEKRRGSNAVTVSRELRAKLPEIERSLRFPVTFEVDEDEGGELEDKLMELIYRSLIILGVLFLLLLAFMRDLQLAGTVVASILFAVMISLSFFYFLGISVNFITISGLTVCFGMILDNSILVLDSVHRRISMAVGGLRKGWRRRITLPQALVEIAEGTGEVGFPILATTLTTIVAFLSFVFLSGRLSLYYAPLAVAVVTALAASIFVALGWMPVALRTLWLRVGQGSTPASGGRPDHPVDASSTEAQASGRRPESVADLLAEPIWRPNRFERAVRLTLRGWWVVLLIAVGAMIGGWFIYQDKVDKGGFWRMPEREMLYLGIRLPEGTDVLMTYETMRRFEREILPVPEGIRMRTSVYRNRGHMQITFEDEMLYSELPLLYRSYLIDMAEKMAGMGIYLRGFADQAYVKGFFGGVNFNSTIKIAGYNSKILERIGAGMLRRVERNRRVRQARVLNDLRRVYSAQDESIISIQRERLKDYDLTVAEVVVFLRRLIGLDYPTNMVIDGEAERVQLSYDDSEEIEFDEVADQIIHTSSGRRVRLGEILTLETIPLAGPIVREDQRYAKYVTWEYIGTESMRSRYIKSVLERLTLPYGYTAEEAEQQFLSEEEETELTLMLILAIAFIYMILAALFESLSLPILVLFSVPMSLVGVFAIFWLTDSTFDSSAHIGLILLFGIVVNNAILLVARFRTEARDMLHARGENEQIHGSASRPRSVRGAFEMRRLPRSKRVGLLIETICAGTRVRLRSILLTSGTTVVGLAPLLIRFEELEGKDIWENLALSSIGGLTASVILILLALPATYYVSVRVGWFCHERLGRRRRL
jgi:HAE1 family hydrophobic/amphiphilic exporter-1